MTKLYTIVLWMFAATANAQWWIQEDSDAMTGKVDTYAMAEVKERGFHAQIAFRCNPGEIRPIPVQTDEFWVTGTTIEIAVSIFDGWLVTDVDRNFNVYSPMRVNFTDEVWVWDFTQSTLYTNMFTYGEYNNRGAALLYQMLPLNFKLELAQETGTKHLIKGDMTLLEFVGKCKIAMVALIEEQDRRNAIVKQAKAEAEAEAEATAIRERELEKKNAEDQYLNAVIAQVQKYIKISPEYVTENDSCSFTVDYGMKNITCTNKKLEKAFIRALEKGPRRFGHFKWTAHMTVSSDALTPPQ